MHNAAVRFLLAALALGLGACAQMQMPLLPGEQAANRIFATEPMARVKRASVSALAGMQASLQELRKTANGEVVVGRSGNREIEIELEPYGKGGTRIRVLAREGPLYYDRATAAEVLRRVEELLANSG